MKNVHDSLASFVGSTPAVRLRRLAEESRASVYGKLEFLNGAGSAKARLGQAVLDDAEKSGRLRPGGTLIDVVSGSMGVGLAMAAVARGYRAVFVVPDKQSEENRAALRAYGARVVVAPSNVERDDPRSPVSVARRIAEETPNSLFVDSAQNPLNPDTHYQVTGPELWDQFEGRIDVFVAGIGTGGTLSGVGRFLKEKNPKTRVIGVDPVGSVLYDYFYAGQTTSVHTWSVEGLGSNTVPGTLDFQYVDDVFRVTDKEAFQMTRRLVREEGIFAGGSSGAAVAGAMKFLRNNDEPDLQVVVVLPDSGSFYLSKIFNDTWMRENGFLEPDTGFGTVRDLLKDMGPQDLITVSAATRVPEVIGVLKLHGISQVPVVDGERLVGILTESRILERAMRGGAPDTLARNLVESNYCTVDKETDLTLLLELFRQARVAVVVEGGRPTNIITRIDIIDFVSRAASFPREP